MIKGGWLAIPLVQFSGVQPLGLEGCMPPLALVARLIDVTTIVSRGTHGYLLGRVL